MTIRELGRIFGLSRATLLYYDRIGLLSPTCRSTAGYRLYDREAEERLRLIVTYKSFGLTLADIRELLDRPASADKEIIENRIREIGREKEELERKQRALLRILQGGETEERIIDRETWVEILAQSGLDREGRERWHTEFEKHAPEAHHSFLKWLGLSESETARICQRCHDGN